MLAEEGPSENKDLREKKFGLSPERRLELP